MLLRRIKHHVVNENWFAVFVDFVIVVVGVYVGIEVSNWNEARQEDARAQYFLERIRNDLTIDRAQATNKQEFWGSVVDYGEAAIAHAEKGELYRGSTRQTVLAYYQASQVNPYAAVSTAYDELRTAGELRLIRNPALRTRLAEYYVNATSLQAQHLFQYLPEYRAYIRGRIPHDIQRYVWDNCHATERGDQTLLDCELPMSEEEGRLLLDKLSSDPGVVRGLRFWIANLIVASKVIDDNLEQTDALLELVDRSLGGGS